MIVWVKAVRRNELAMLCADEVHEDAFAEHLSSSLHLVAVSAADG